ncbi:MAG TPA: two-component regulator propeller domain-containing protein, partial [Verrucomicrobiae bacterium]|nr:two-component regulator propeller domain-containing protein [Verrucomicrobiae bacterium]
GAMTPVSLNDGNVLIWTQRGALAWNGATFTPTIEAPNNGDVFAPSRHGGSWRTLGGNIVRIDRDQIVDRRDGPDALNAGVATMFEDRAGNLWVGLMGAGVVRYDPSGKRDWIAGSYDLSHAQVRCLFEDHEGNIWVGTDGAGLHRLRIGAFSVIDKNAGLGADIALAVTETEDGLWIGTNGGGLAHEKDNQAETLNASGVVHVWTLLAAKDKTLWIGTWGAGGFKKIGDRVEPAPELNPLAGIILASHEDAAGKLWFGGPGGLIRVAHGKAKHFTRAEGLSHNDVRAIIDDGEGGLWLGLNGGGINHYRNGKFEAIRKNNGLASDEVWALHRDSSNALWIGTFGGGLSVMRGPTINSFTTEDGLPSGVICSITEDEAGYLWMSSYSGVFRIQKQELLNYKHTPLHKLDFTVFTKSDGLPSRECTGSFQPAVCKMRDGRLVYPTVKGVAIVDPRHIPVNPIPPQVTIEEAEIDGESIPLDPISAIFTIRPNRAQVQFRYTGLSFSAPEKVRFRYRLEPLDKEWQDAGPRRTAYYSHLPPGDYRFHVIAANNDGIWNNTGSILAIRVIPAFWQTYWFLAACVFMIGGAIAGSIRYVEVRKLQRKMQLLEQQHAVERERARIAKDMHDDLGASLTQITLLSELARTDLNRPAQAEAHIRQISGTARELTRAMDEIVWAVNPQNDTLEDLLTYTVKFAQEHLGLARIRCRLDVPAHLPPLHLSAEIRHNLFLAIKEAINNVVKHSKATEAWLRLRTHQTHFVFEVEDNGASIPPSVLTGRTEDLTTPGSHNGLRNMDRRLTEIGGSFEILPRQGGGAIIRMSVDISSP